MNQVSIFDFVEDPLYEEIDKISLNKSRSFVFNKVNFTVKKKQMGIRELFEFEYREGHGLAKSIPELIKKIEEIEKTCGVYHD